MFTVSTPDCPVTKWQLNVQGSATEINELNSGRAFDRFNYKEKTDQSNLELRTAYDHRGNFTVEADLVVYIGNPPQQFL